MSFLTQFLFKPNIKSFQNIEVSVTALTTNITIAAVDTNMTTILYGGRRGSAVGGMSDGAGGWTAYFENGVMDATIRLINSTTVRIQRNLTTPAGTIVTPSITYCFQVVEWN